jgi:PAS domain S-box-containing protein
MATPFVRSEEELLRALADNIPAMLAYWDSALRCRFANRAHERWLGISPDSLIGKHVSEVLGPLYPLDLPYIEGALRGVPQQFEREIPDPFGGPFRHGLASYVPEVADGVVIGFFVLVTDISEAKGAEEALRRSEAKFSGILSVSDDAIISVDETQAITMFNEGAERVFGYKKAEIIGSPLDALIPERFRVKHRQHVERFAAGSKPTTRKAGERNVFGLRKNGEEFPADAVISKLETGGKMVLTVSLRDVSEHRRADDGERLLGRIGDAAMTAGSNIAQLTTDVARAIADAFAGWCIVDIVHAENVRLRRLVHADEAMAATCRALENYPARERSGPVWQAFDTRESVLQSDVTPEYLESLARGPEHLRLMRQLDPGSFIVVPLVARGRALGTLGIGAARSSRRLDRKDLHLAERVAGRVALAADNARLYEALERAVHAREDVLGVVAHDLRNPLNSILLNSQVLRRPGRESGDLDTSDRIYRAAMRMNRLIQDLLDVTRLEGGQSLMVAQDTVATASVLADAVEEQRAAIHASALMLEVDAPRVSPSVWADRARLLQVLDNLLGNAIKFARQRITLGVRLQKGEVLFWVADDGVGIPPADQARLFDRFWQSKRNDRRRGAGLGLSIVKGIVEVHGGRIWVESEVGAGTTFFFTLPVAPRPATQASRSPA